MEKTRQQSHPNWTIKTPKLTREVVFTSILDLIPRRSHLLNKAFKDFKQSNCLTMDLQTHLRTRHACEAAEAPQINESMQHRESFDRLLFSTGSYSRLFAYIMSSLTRWQDLCKDAASLYYKCFYRGFLAHDGADIKFQIKQLHDNLEIVRARLKDKKLALTTEGWTLMISHAYETVIGHGSLDSWESDSYVLFIKS